MVVIQTIGNTMRSRAGNNFYQYCQRGNLLYLIIHEIFHHIGFYWASRFLCFSVRNESRIYTYSVSKWKSARYVNRYKVFHWLPTEHFDKILRHLLTTIGSRNTSSFLFPLPIGFQSFSVRFLNSFWPLNSDHYFHYQKLYIFMWLVSLKDVSVFLKPINVTLFTIIKLKINCESTVFHSNNVSIHCSLIFLWRR